MPGRASAARPTLLETRPMAKTNRTGRPTATLAAGTRGEGRHAEADQGEKRQDDARPHRQVAGQKGGKEDRRLAAQARGGDRQVSQIDRQVGRIDRTDQVGGGDESRREEGVGRQGRVAKGVGESVGGSCGEDGGQAESGRRANGQGGEAAGRRDEVAGRQGLRGQEGRH